MLASDERPDPESFIDFSDHDDDTLDERDGKCTAARSGDESDWR